MVLFSKDEGTFWRGFSLQVEEIGRYWEWGMIDGPMWQAQS